MLLESSDAGSTAGVSRVWHLHRKATLRGRSDGLAQMSQCRRASSQGMRAPQLGKLTVLIISFNKRLFCTRQTQGDREAEHKAARKPRSTAKIMHKVLVQKKPVSERVSRGTAWVRVSSGDQRTAAKGHLMGHEPHQGCPSHVLEHEQHPTGQEK